MEFWTKVVQMKEKIFKYERFIIYSLYLLILIILRLYYDRLEKADAYYKKPWDHWFYIKMAEDITSIFKYKIRAPFCYRPLVPFLAGVLPFGVETNFFIINFLGIYLTGILLYTTLRLNFNIKLSITGLIMFCSFEIIEILFFDFYLVDSLAFFFIILCFYSILTSNNKLYCLSLFLGVLTKEVVLFTIPVFLSYSLNFEDFKLFIMKKNMKFSIEFLKLILVILPALSIFILLRIIIKPHPNLISDNYLELMPELVDMRINKFLDDPLSYYKYAIIWGLVTLIFCFFNIKKKFIDWVKHFGIFMILVYFQLFLAYGSTRLLYMGFYPIILLSVSGINRLIQHEKERIIEKELYLKGKIAYDHKKRKYFEI